MCFEEWDTSQESTSVSPDRNLVRFRIWRKKQKFEIVDSDQQFFELFPDIALEHIDKVIYILVIVA